MRFLYNAPAIFHKGALIIGDTHFGIESRLKKRGIYQNNFSEMIADKIITLAKKTRAKKIIFLGDVKEDITYLDDHTIRVFQKLRKEKFEIIIVRGNHDAGVENLGLGIQFIPSEGFVHDRLALAHGHSWPSEECMNAKYLVVAHQHPQIEFIDASGKCHIEPVWLYAEADGKNIAKKYKKFNKKIKLIMIPAFNPVVGTVLKNDSDSRLGPILNNKLFKWNEAIVYRLNGVAVGKLSNILRWPDGK